MATLKDLTKRPEGFVSGHRACAGCIPAVAIRQVLLTAKQPDVYIVSAIATGCMEVVSTIMPYTAWSIPLIHNAFENSAATISGVEAAYKALKRKGKINKKIKFIAFGGDGGTYDIGLQSLSGAVERGHDFLYVTYDNEGYMNTGYQRSSATPLHAHTTTSPAGSKIPGKIQTRKDLTEIIVAHEPSYAAQATPAFYMDLIKKVEKALSKEGPTFINILAPCIPGWAIKEDSGMTLSKLAVETGFWPIYEYEDGTYKLNYKPRNYSFKPVEEFLKPQGRFRHLFKPGNEHLIEEIKRDIAKRWITLLRKSGIEQEEINKWQKELNYVN